MNLLILLMVVLRDLEDEDNVLQIKDEVIKDEVKEYDPQKEEKTLNR
jgi:hypothetical protein